jgi:hypothetical protein
MASYTDQQILFIKELVSKIGNSWGKVSEQFNKVFDENKSANAIRKTYESYKSVDFSDNVIVSNLEKARKSSLENTKLKKTQNVLLDDKITLSYVLKELKSAVENGKFKNIYIPTKTKEDKTKKEMIVEVLYGDIHAGKQSDNFNKDILEKSLSEYSKVIQQEIRRYESLYNINTVIFAILGDLIENSYFHNMESMSACEIENSEQIRIITELTFKYFLVPLAKTGKKIIIPCVTGNHDRWLSHPTYNEPGKNNISYIMYKFLEFLCKETGLHNIEFRIPANLYCTVDIFGKTVLYEHGSEIRSTKESDIETHIHKRSKQIGKMIDYFRMGDKHNSTIYNRGRIVINSSVCGTDSYADVKGYSGSASQTINYYINRKEGKDPFYHAFIVDLDTEK